MVAERGSGVILSVMQDGRAGVRYVSTAQRLRRNRAWRVEEANTGGDPSANSDSYSMLPLHRGALAAVNRRMVE